MDYIMMKLRRVRRKNRVPHGLLVSAAMMLMLVTVLSVSLLAVPASAKVRITMPRTEDGIVTDDDGIIDSSGIAGDVPEMTDLLTNDGSAGTEGSDALDPVTSDTGTTAESTTGSATTDRVTTDGATTDGATTGMMDDAADAMGVSPWVIGLILIAVLAVVVILIVWWVSGSRKH